MPWDVNSYELGDKEEFLSECQDSCATVNTVSCSTLRNGMPLALSSSENGNLEFHIYKT